MIPFATPRTALLSLALLFAALTAPRAADQPQWGQAWSRNMVSAETGLPAAFDPKSGQNVKWSAPLGTESYATPVVAGGRVFIGTNNVRPRDPKHAGDRGILLCLDEKDGSLCWQLVVPKLCTPDDPYLDWPNIGLCSPPTVEGDRVYLLTNRNEVMCLDIHGLKNGNDGPFKDEARQLTPRDAQTPEELTPTDADILWVYDMPKELHALPHDGAHTSIMILGRHLYVNTCNGVARKHEGIRNPGGPSLLVIDKETGKLLAMDREAINPFHCNWSATALGEVGGRTLLFYGASDPWLRAFEPLPQDAPAGAVQTLKLAWKADLDPASPKEGDMHKYLRNRKEGPVVVEGMPVFDSGRVYACAGGDIWWGKTQCWLKCVDAVTGKVAWEYPMEKYAVTTPAIKDGLVYVADCGGVIHCVDAASGRPCWTHKGEGDFWGSALVADGKVYIGSRRGAFYVFAAGREKKLLSEARFSSADGAINATPVAANGALYVSTMKKLYAIQAK